MDFEVTYPSGNKWIFNPAVLTKVKDSKEEFNTIVKNNLKTLGDSTKNALTVNSLVQITDDLVKLQLLQIDHGGWAEEMLMVGINMLNFSKNLFERKKNSFNKKTLGKVGRIVKIYPDNDLKIEVEGKTWTFSMLAVSKFENSEFLRTGSTWSNQSRINSHRCSFSIDIFFSIQLIIFNNFKGLIKPSELNEELIIAAAEGNLLKCKEKLNRPNSNVIYLKFCLKNKK